MSHKKFDEKKSRELVICFFNRLHAECQPLLGSTKLERLRYIVDLFGNDPTGPEIWKTTYQMTFGKSLELISEEEILTTLIGFCAKLTHSWEFNLTGLIDLLFLIRYQPEKNEKEYTIWKEVIASFNAKTPF